MPPKISDPVVIPPLNVAGKFTCIGDGLMYESNHRETPQQLQVMLFPNANGERMPDREKKKSWWVAQALLYGLECGNPKTATIGVCRTLLEAAIKSKSLAVPKDIIDMEKKANREFKKLNKEVLEKTGNATSTTTAKATSKTSSNSAKASTAKKTDMPKPPKMTPQNTVAKPKDTVTKPPKATSSTATPVVEKSKKVKTASKNTEVPVAPVGKGKRRATDEPEGSSPQKKPRAPSKAKPKTAKEVHDFPQSVRAPSTTRPPFFDDPPMKWKLEEYDDDAMDIDEDYQSEAPEGPPPTDPAAGVWKLECPYISGHWSIESPMELNLVRTHGNQHIEGDFDLGLLKGFLRSTKMEGRAGGGVYATFEWCGQEEDGPVLPPERGMTGYIKFTRNAETGYPELKGAINGISLCGDGPTEINGRWMRAGRKNEHRWDDFDQEAYNRASAARWGGCF